MPKIVWLFLFCGMVIYTLGDYFSKVFSNTNSFWMGFIAFALYSLSGLAWLAGIERYNHIAILGTIWIVFMSISSPFVGIVIFKEGITLTLQQIIGIVVGFVSILLLSI
jgi:hypothetical protein